MAEGYQGNNELIRDLTKLVNSHETMVSAFVIKVGPETTEAPQQIWQECEKIRVVNAVPKANAKTASKKRGAAEPYQEFLPCGLFNSPERTLGLSINSPVPPRLAVPSARIAVPSGHGAQHDMW